MFNKYSYKTVPLAEFSEIKLTKKKKIDQNEVFTAFTNVLFLFSLWLRMYTFVQRILAECLMN